MSDLDDTISVLYRRSLGLLFIVLLLVTVGLAIYLLLITGVI